MVISNSPADAFKIICSRFADKTAVIDKSNAISYKELLTSIECVSEYLSSIGIKPGDRVALMIDNSIDYIIAFYAIWKVGAIVVSINPAAKVHEIIKLTKQSGAKLIIIDRLHPDLIEYFKASEVHMMQRSELEAKSTQENKIHNFSMALNYPRNEEWFSYTPETLAQIIYTSGTTGDPKGVLLSHGNLVGNLNDIVNYLELSDSDKVLNVLPFHYCYGNSVLHSHLMVGATVVLSGSMAFPQEVVNQMREYAATGFSGVPSTYNLFLSRSDWPDNPPKLRYMTQAGGPMGKDLTKRLIANSDQNTQLYVMYGQTEATARITYLPPQMLLKKLGSAGIPLTSVDIQIRNDNGDEMETGKVGEVFVNGVGVMQGYWQNPQATDKTLIDGWLKTGDLGFIDEDGYLFLQGRNSDMIKVGAHRINPLEIEEIINQLPFVLESAVIGIPDEILGHKLQVFLVGEESRENTMMLKKHCNEYLAAHKIPKDLVWVSSLPKTSSGKIKRHELTLERK